MFLVGLEVDPSQLKGRVTQAAAISNASVARADAARHRWRRCRSTSSSGPDKKFVAFALFMGVSMSITAFPVLARILVERRMLKRPIGALALACAAIDDVTAWFLIALATTIAARRGSFGDVAKTIGEAVGVHAASWCSSSGALLARPPTAYDEAGRIPGGWFAAIFAGVLLVRLRDRGDRHRGHLRRLRDGHWSCRATRGLTEDVTRRIEDFVVALLLPLFFAYTGLRTNVLLLDRRPLWLLTLVLIVVAIVGKFGGDDRWPRGSPGYGWRSRP